MGAVVVGDMGHRHVDLVSALEREIFPDPWSRDAFLHEITLGFEGWTRVAEDEGTGEVLAYVVGWFVADEVHVGNLAVAPFARRRGLGRRLLDEFIAEGRRRRARLVTLEVRRSNLVAQTLYREAGFEVTMIRRGYYQNNGEDALVMMKLLNGVPAAPRRRTRKR